MWEKLNFQAVIKSAASAASPIAWGEPGRRLRLAGDGFGALPTALAIGEDALAADLITAWKFSFFYKVIHPASLNFIEEVFAVTSLAEVV